MHHIKKSIDERIAIIYKERIKQTDPSKLLLIIVEKDKFDDEYVRYTKERLLEINQN